MSTIHTLRFDDARSQGGVEKPRARPAEIPAEARKRPLDFQEARDKRVLDEARGQAEETLASIGLKLRFKVDEESDTVQVEIVDPGSGKVVRKLPPDDLLKLSRSIRDMARGLLDKTY
ncbi:flagellar protein FlaG [Desulfohalovibrio reitneri]|uniref:flagellar protein FlaG n=1 Tax=Desulfohalovibrio reitneri TaxID=1307759 RepID=UPI00068ECBAF|nr:flagellar protein FlaG [Desulfohalovibrio reitneri]